MRGGLAILLRPWRGLLAFLTAAGLMLVLGGGCDRLPTEPARSSVLAVRGITCVDWTAEGYASPAAGTAVADIAATGANVAVFVITAYQSGATSSTVRENAARTASPAAIRSVVSTAIDHGLDPALKLHVDLDDGSWRGEIEPSDLTAWFRSYREFVLPWAMLAEETGSRQFVFATELCRIVHHEAHWVDLIAEIRSRYSGDLVYAASWDEANLVPFWSHLDAVGVDFYFPVAARKNPGRFEILCGWQPWLDRLRSLHARAGRKILLTEIGYRSVDGAGMHPALFGTDEALDLEEQADLYWAALEATRDQDWIAGVYWWNWLATNAGGPEDDDFTPCRKPAEDQLRSAWGE